MIFSTVMVAILFGLYVFFDIMSSIPRISGSLIGMNGLAYSFQVMVATMKRVLLVLYPPFVGYLSMQGGAESVFHAIAGAYVAGMVSVVFCFLFRARVAAIFCSSLSFYSQGKGTLSSLLKGLGGHSLWIERVKTEVFKRNGSSLMGVDLGLYFPAVWIYFFFSSSVFLVNIISVRFSEYSDVILQTTGFLNALGSLALAFYLDPKISIRYEEKRNVGEVSNSIFWGHATNLFLIGPLFFFIIYILLGVLE